jgi:hypothetical protein
MLSILSWLIYLVLVQRRDQMANLSVYLESVRIIFRQKFKLLT